VKIKHSKYKNTGLIFELLVKQVTADTLAQRDSQAIKIIKKYFTGDSALVREHKLYNFIIKNKGIGQKKAETIVSTIVEISRKIDSESLKKIKYNLIRDIKESYNLDYFFSAKVDNYKPLAALYCLLEAQNTPDLIDPEVLVENKTTILEHLLQSKAEVGAARNSLIEEYSKYDKDLRLLTYKLLLEKFNNKYKNLLPEQKNILREFIVSVNSSAKLREFINRETATIKEAILEAIPSIEDSIVKIKLEEIAKTVKSIKPTQRVDDNHLISLMQYYELVNELKSL